MLLLHQLKRPRVFELHNSLDNVFGPPKPEASDLLLTNLVLTYYKVE